MEHEGATKSKKEKKISLGEIASLVGGAHQGDPGIVITGITNPGELKVGALCVVWEKKSRASLLPEQPVLTKPGWIPAGGSGVEVADPRKAMVLLLKYFDSKRRPAPGVHESSVVDSTVELGAGVTIGPGCVVCAGAKIGDWTVLEANVYIGAETHVGADCRLEPGACVLERVRIGDRVILHCNCAIGCDGFGFVADEQGRRIKIPQIGTVVLEDDVEIGACSTVDRAVFGETRICRGAKLDNIIQIGHNVVVGEDCALAAMSGVAGSSRIGRRVVMGAQSGVGNHAVVGDDVMIGGRAGVSKDVPDRAVISGFPAQPHRDELRFQASLREVPALIDRVRKLEALMKAKEKK